MSGLQLLQAGPPVEPRKETVDVPEWGGAVIVRGLLASELFAISGLRSQALRTLREARREYAEHCKGLPAGTQPPPFEAPELSFAEMQAYGRYLSQLLAAAVTVQNGLALYTAEQWEGVPERLQAVAERLSGLNTEDVEKNLPPSPS
jgi:hypothetical protein